MTPLKEGDLERSHPGARPALVRLSTSITSLRQAAEWGMGSVEKVYQRLQLPLPYNPSIRRRRLMVTHHLFNYRVRTTGISQIKAYFECN